MKTKHLLANARDFTVNNKMMNIFNNHTTEIVPPVHSISVNKYRVIFTDSQGQKNTLLANASQTRQFVDQLINS